MIRIARIPLRATRTGSVSSWSGRTLGYRKLYRPKEQLFSSSSALTVQFMNLTDATVEPITYSSVDHPYLPHISKRIGNHEKYGKLRVSSERQSEGDWSTVNSNLKNNIASSTQTESLDFYQPMVISKPQQLPPSLRSKLSLASDSHLRLSTILAYKYPFRIQVGYLESFLRKEFKQNDMMKIFCEELSIEVILRIARFFVSQRNFRGLAAIYFYLYQNDRSRYLHHFNSIVLKTMDKENERDLSIGAFLMCLYQQCGRDKSKFRDVFNFTGLDASLQNVSGTSMPFLSALKMVQLEDFILSCEDVSRLPPEFMETGFSNVDTAIALKLLKQGHTERGFGLIKSAKLYQVGGLFQRVLSVKGGSGDFEDHILELMSKMKGYQFQEIDAIKWRKLNFSDDFYNKSLEILQDSDSILLFKNQELYRLLKYRSMKRAIHFLLENLTEVQYLDIKTVSIVLLNTHDLHLFHKLQGQFSSQEQLVRLSVARIVSDKSLSVYEKWHRLVCALNGLTIDEETAELLTGFLHALKNPGQVIHLLTGIKFSTEEALLVTLKPLRPDVSLEVSKHLFIEGKVDVLKFSRFLSEEYSLSQIVELMSKCYSHRRYRWLHCSLTKLFVSKDELDKCLLLHSALKRSDVESVRILLEAQIISGRYPNLSIDQLKLREVHRIYFDLLIRLVNREDIVMTEGINKKISMLFKSGQIDRKILSTELLKHAAYKTKMHSPPDELIITEKLKHFVDTCIQNRVDQSVINEILGTNIY